jgi:hypothetical protein
LVENTRHVTKQPWRVSKENLQELAAAACISIFKHCRHRTFIQQINQDTAQIYIAVPCSCST